MTRIANGHENIVACFGEGCVDIAAPHAAAPAKGTASSISRSPSSQPCIVTVPVLSLEFAHGGDLLAQVQAVAGPQGLGDCSATQLGAAQLAAAIAFCHAHGVAHRDIKPENILECGERGAPCWKLADFGAASVSKVDPALSSSAGVRIESSRAIGSAAYAAPEVVAHMCSHRPEDGSQALDYEIYGVDVWSFGVTLFVLASGRIPFKRASGSDMAFLGFCAQTQAQVLSPRAAQLAPAWRWPAHFSAELVAVLTACLQVDTRQRSSMSEVCNMPWLAAARNGAAVPCLDAPSASSQQAVASGGGAAVASGGGSVAAHGVCSSTLSGRRDSVPRASVASSSTGGSGEGGLPAAGCSHGASATAAATALAVPASTPVLPRLCASQGQVCTDLEATAPRSPCVAMESVLGTTNSQRVRLPEAGIPSLAHNVTGVRLPPIDGDGLLAQ